MSKKHKNRYFGGTDGVSAPVGTPWTPSKHWKNAEVGRPSGLSGYGGTHYGGSSVHSYTGKTCTHPPKAIKLGDITIYSGARRDLTREAMFDPFDIICPLITSSAKEFERFTGLILWMPITDFSAPDPKQLRIQIDRMIQFARNGCRVMTFCEGGHGRTGLVLASILALLEPDVDPIDEIRARHCKHAVETAKQLETVFKTADREVPAKWLVPGKPPIMYQPSFTPETSKSFIDVLGDEAFSVRDKARPDAAQKVVIPANPVPESTRTYPHERGVHVEPILPGLGSAEIGALEALTKELGVAPDGVAFTPSQSMNETEPLYVSDSDIFEVMPEVAVAKAKTEPAVTPREAEISDGAGDQGRPFWARWSDNEQLTFSTRTGETINEQDEWADTLCGLCQDPFMEPHDLVVVSYPNSGIKIAIHPRCVKRAHRNLERRWQHRMAKEERKKVGITLNDDYRRGGEDHE